MTLVAGFTTAYGAFVVADSRLVRMRNGVLAARQDVCQKVFPLSKEILVGFSNGALSAVRLLRRLARSDYANSTEWLLDQDRALHVLKGLYRRAEQTKLPGPQVQLLFAVHHLAASEGKELMVPNVGLVRVDCDPWAYQLIGDGVEVIGAAGDIRTGAVEDESAPRLAKLTPYDERGLALRALFAHSCVRRLMRDRDEPTVGGLYQLYYVGAHGPTAVPYDTWGEIGPDSGTLVSMLVDPRGWIQQHEPTGVRVFVQNPLVDERVVRSTSGSEVFAVSEFLSPGGPGVRRAGRRVTWEAALHPHVYRYEESTGGFTKKIVLPPVNSGDRSAFAQLVQPMFEIGAQQDWVEHPDRYFGPRRQ